MSNCQLDKNDRAVLEAGKLKDDEIQVKHPFRHDTYSECLKAEREVRTMQFLQQQLRDGCTVYDAGRIMARGDGQPDKPGTVRAPGTRRVSHRKARWAIFSGK